MDLIIQKATELGVAEIVPVRTERAQGWLAGERGASRLRRWKRIAQEAARQCGRSRVPSVTPLAELTQVLQQKETTGLKLLFWEEEERGSLRQTIAEKVRASEVYVLIGPEGGFTADEVEQAVAAGFRSISLGRRILRTETAAIIAIGLLQYELGDLGLLP
jgi:16S rRNA (uracil1498-N3)-methyltransferase